MDNCDEWEGTLSSNGYGLIFPYDPDKKATVTMRVHRMVWMQDNGPIPDDLLVMHSCDNRKCINIQHLSLGTPSDNILDSADKKRHHNSRKTHCPYGHPYAGHNLIEKTYRGWRARQCRTCRNEREARRRQRSRTRSNA